MIRATFHLRFSGRAEPIARAVHELTDQMADAGFVFDDDFDLILEPVEGSHRAAGLGLHTGAAVAFALEALAGIDAYMVETNEELV